MFVCFFYFIVLTIETPQYRLMTSTKSGEAEPPIAVDDFLIQYSCYGFFKCNVDFISLDFPKLLLC